MPYLVVIEQSADGFGACVPDLPGCIAVGDTTDEIRKLIREAIELHVDDMRERGEPVPAPTTAAEFVELPRNFIDQR